jgi:hypothetical protein
MLAKIDRARERRARDALVPQVVAPHVRCEQVVRGVVARPALLLCAQLCERNEALFERELSRRLAFLDEEEA